MFKGYQLLGDSLLLRFAEHILGEPCIYKAGLRYLGLCVSGQTSQQLLKRIEGQFSPLGSKAILLIGTNDMMQGVPIEDMKCALKRLVGYLEKFMSHIVVLTLPPIPRLETQHGFWYKLVEYNSFIYELEVRSKVSVVDTHVLFLERDFKSDVDFFERWFDDDKHRVDMVHLNKKGLLKLRNHLINCDDLCKNSSIGS